MKAEASAFDAWQHALTRADLDGYARTKNACYDLSLVIDTVEAVQPTAGKSMIKQTESICFELWLHCLQLPMDQESQAQSAPASRTVEEQQQQQQQHFNEVLEVRQALMEHLALSSWSLEGSRWHPERPVKWIHIISPS